VTVAFAANALFGFEVVAEGICETSLVNIADTIDDARRAFEIAGRGCLAPAEAYQGLSAVFKETGRPTSTFPGVSGASRETPVGFPGVTADGDGAANRFRSVTPRVEQQRPVVAEASHVSRRNVDRRDRNRRKSGNISSADYAPPASLHARRLLVFGSSRRIRSVVCDPQGDSRPPIRPNAIRPRACSGSTGSESRTTPDRAIESVRGSRR